MGNYRYESPALGPKALEMIKKDKEVIFGAHTRSREIPLVIESAKGVRIKDVDGNTFLDFGAGYSVASTGYSHPEIVKILKDQSEILIHNPGSDFYYHTQVTLAKKLIDLAPGDFPKQVYFGCTGAEMVESAFKLTRYYTRRSKAISFYGAFHGRTYCGMSLSGSKKVQRAHFAPLVSEIIHTLYPYCYRCMFKMSYPDCMKGQGEFEGIPMLPCVSFLTDHIFVRLLDPTEVGAIFVEPIQGEGGYIVPPPEFYRLLRAIATKWEIPFVVDEIQSGLGRTGKMFAIEHWNVAPDVILIAKGLASGVPISAVIAPSKMMDPSIDGRGWVAGSHGSTFGGNALATAVAVKTLEMIEGELMENASKTGTYMIEKLQDMKDRHKIIGDVRGKGLMIGIEIVKDRETKERFPDDFTTDGKDIKSVIVGGAYKRGMIMFGCGFNSIRMSPPLTITKSDADEALGIFEDVIGEIEKNL